MILDRTKEKKDGNACSMTGKKPLRKDLSPLSVPPHGWCHECERWIRVTKSGVFAKHHYSEHARIERKRRR